MNKGEIWCLNKIKSGLLVMTDNLTIKVCHGTNGRIYTKTPSNILYQADIVFVLVLDDGQSTETDWSG